MTDKPDKPRIFLSATYLVEVERGTFGLYRNLLIEKDGVKEKIGKPIGPIGLFRKTEGNEQPDLRSSDKDGNPVSLKAITK